MIAAHLFASLAAGLSWGFGAGDFEDVGRGILLFGLARGLAKLAPRFETRAGEPVSDTVEALDILGLDCAARVLLAREAGREAAPFERRLADDAVG